MFVECFRRVFPLVVAAIFLSGCESPGVPQFPSAPGFVDDITNALFETLFGTRPESPGDAAAVQEDAVGIRVTWDDLSDTEDGFYIYRSVNGSGWYSLATTKANRTTILDTSVEFGSSYRYRVAAYNNHGRSEFSKTNAVTYRLPVPASPTAATAVQQSTVAIVSWNDNSSDEDGFNIYRSENGGAFMLLTTLATDTNGYTDSSVQFESTYDYRIYAFNVYGESADVAAPALFMRTPIPTTPTDAMVVQHSPAGLDVSWSDNSSDEAGFYLYRSLDQINFDLQATLPAGTTTYVDSSVISLQGYSYRVSAFNDFGESDPSTSAVIEFVYFDRCSNTLPDLPTVATATFSDIVVEGLNYRSGSHFYTTDGSGAFYYDAAGEHVEFSIGYIPIDYFNNQSVISLDRFFKNPDTSYADQQRAKQNLLSLLVTLDDDQDVTTGIHLSCELSTATGTIDFFLPADEFLVQPTVIALTAGKALVAPTIAYGGYRYLRYAAYQGTYDFEFKFMYLGVFPVSGTYTITFDAYGIPTIDYQAVDLTAIDFNLDDPDNLTITSAGLYYFVYDTAYGVEIRGNLAADTTFAGSSMMYFLSGDSLTGSATGTKLP